MGDPRAPRPKLTPGLLREPVHLLALGFGTGLSPLAPGTFGTLLALPLAWALVGLPVPAAIAAVATLVLGGIWICGESARRLGCAAARLAQVADKDSIPACRLRSLGGKLLHEVDEGRVSPIAVT